MKKVSIQKLIEADELPQEKLLSYFRPGTKFRVGIIDTIKLMKVELDEKRHMRMTNKIIAVEMDFDAQSMYVLTSQGSVLWLVGRDKDSGELVGAAMASLIDHHRRGTIDIDFD